MMNQAQLKYARTRAEKIYAEKVKEVSAEFVTPAVHFKAPEIQKAIAQGRFRLRTLTPNYSNSLYLRDILEFPEECPAVVDTKGQIEALGELKKEYNNLMDELMLGDNEQALAMLKAFEAL